MQPPTLTHLSLKIGIHRPVYLWAGPGTIRMNRLKFMNAPVDEAVHHEAHTSTGAQRMSSEEANFSWAYLMYDWGFPPEIEQQDWQEFQRAVDVYHRQGMRVFGYVQTSNCVYDGSYREKDWYAQDPRGRKFYYYTGRYMTCWRHPEWLEHLHEMACGVVEAGADGVFFDNPWHACQPIRFGGAWMGPAGCYCPRCRAAFREDTGFEIPTEISPENDPLSRRYLIWRANHVSQTLETFAHYSRSLKDGVIFSVNNFDAVMRPSYTIYGIDLPALARVQDVVMIEDYGLPRWGGWNAPERERSKHTIPEPLLVNNALTLRTARALVGSTHLSTDPYDKGIGFDGVYPGRRLQQGIVEAAACGASMVVKGTEYVEGGSFTLLTASKFKAQREAVGAYHSWLEAHSHLYSDRENKARVGLLYPGEALWQDWGRYASPYFQAGQTLLAAKIPWKVILPEEVDASLEELDKLIICSDAAGLPAVPSTKCVALHELPGWEPKPASILARYAGLRKIVAPLIVELYRAYFRFRWARSLGDRLGLVHFFLQSPYFQLPPQSARLELLMALGDTDFPQVKSKEPILVEVWQQGDERQLHLVNYAPQPQEVQVSFGRFVHGQILSPGQKAIPFQAETWQGLLDIYHLILFK